MATRSRRSQKYWAERKARELYENLIPVEEAAEDLRRLYFQASKEIEKEAADIAKRFQLKNNLTEEEAERLLNLVVDPKDIRRMTRELRKDPTNQELIAQLEAPAYAARINRLAKVQDNVNTVVANLLAPVQDTFDSVLRTIAETSFYQSLFGLQEQTGVKFPVIALNEKRVTEILSRRWSGKNFSERLWANSERLSSSVKRELMLGVLTGKTRRQMTQAIQEEFSSASYVTRRLIRTEACYVAGQMDLETYRQNGITEYEYVAILDHRTSEICRELDGQRFPVEEAEVGVNYPPMHPWCRSSTVPAMPKKLEDKIVVQYYDAEGNTVKETLSESRVARVSDGSANQYANLQTSPITRRDYPKGFEDTRNVGEPIDEQVLDDIIELARQNGIRIGLPDDPRGGFESYCGDSLVLRQTIEQLAEAKKRIATITGKDEDVILLYDNLHHEGRLDTDTFAITRGRTITLNKFLYDDSSYLVEEYNEAVKNGIFTRGSSVYNVVDHETGHIILSRKPGFKKRVKESIIQAAVADGVNVEHEKELKEYIKIKVSKYAMTNDSELVAELMAESEGSDPNFAIYILKKAGMI